MADPTTEPEQASVGAISHRAARNAAVRAAGEVGGKVATLAWTVAAARMLSEHDFGVLSFALAGMLVLSSVAAWGFDPVVTSRGAAHPERLPSLYQSAQAWKTLIAAPVVLGAWLALTGHPSLGSGLVLGCLLLAGFPELWSHTARSAAAAREVSSAVSAALVFQRLVTAAAVLAALGAGLGVEGVAVGFLLGTLAGWGAHAAAVRRLDIQRPLRALRRTDLREGIRGTFLLGLSSLVLMLLFRVDVLLLGQLDGPREVAVYSVAYRLLETVLFVTYAINYAVLPVMSAAADRVRRRRGFERAVAVAACCYLPFAVVCLVEGAAVLRLLFGETYADAAAPALAWLAPTPLFVAAATFAASVLLALGHTWELFLGSTLALVVNVGLNLVLIPSHGAVGAAAATAVSYLLQAAVVVAGLRRAGERPALLAPLAPAAGAALVLCVLLVLAPLPLLVELPLGGAAFVGVWLLVVRRVAPEQQQVVLGLLRRRAGGEPPA